MARESHTPEWCGCRATPLDAITTLKQLIFGKSGMGFKQLGSQIADGLYRRPDKIGL